MCLKGKTNEKNGLTLEAEAEKYFQGEMNGEICREYGMNTCTRGWERENKKGRERKKIIHTPGLDNQKILMCFTQTKHANTKTEKHTNKQNKGIQTESCLGQEENEFRF